jgi:hypothetical protein
MPKCHLPFPCMFLHNKICDHIYAHGRCIIFVYALMDCIYMSASSIYCCITRLELGGAGRTCTWSVYSICVCIDGLYVAFPKCNHVINRTPWYVRTPGVMICRVFLLCHGRAPCHGVHAWGYGVHVTSSCKCIVLVHACLLCHANAPLLGYGVHALCVHATNVCKCMVIFMHVLYMPLAPYIQA